MSIFNPSIMQRISYFGKRLKLPSYISPVAMRMKTTVANLSGRIWKIVIHDEPDILRHDAETTLDFLIGGKGF